MPWFMLGNSFFAKSWVGYTLSYERMLAQWEAGNFDQIRPGGALPLAALGGLHAAMK